MSLSRFATIRLETVTRLAQGEAGGSYIDAYLLASATLSGLASHAWPGDGQDQKRFTEAWARFAGANLSPNRVSLPLLVRHLWEKGRGAEASALEGLRPQMFGLGYDCRVLTGDDVDLEDHLVRQACPQLTLREIRQFCYPVLFYREVRSYAVHEYQLGEQSTGWPMTREQAGVSYANMLNDQGGSVRQVHFHVPWLVELILSVAHGLDSALLQGPLIPPATWWRDEV